MNKLCFALLFVSALAAQVPANLLPFSTFLKANSNIKQVATDSTGDIYVYGETDIPTNGYPESVFIAKLDPAAANLTWTVKLAVDSTIARAAAMAVDTAGNAYVTGFTNSPATANTDLPFVAKVNASGATVYYTLFSSGIGGYPAAIAVDGNGDVIVSGNSDPGFPATTGAYHNLWITNPPFVTKLDPTGQKLVFSALGVGGSSLALDAAGNIFIAGTSEASTPGSGFYPTTPGAFQTGFTPFVICAAPICMFGVPAGFQYVTKLSSDGSKLIYSTFVSGALGAYNAGLAVDAAGDAWVTGDTSSTDYPYTQPATSTSLPGTFTTELDPTGSKLLLSVAEGVPPGIGNNLAFDPQGNLIAVGMFPISASNSIPAHALPAPGTPSTAGIPPVCLSGENTYVLRIGSQDGSLLGTKILSGYAAGSSVDSQGNIYIVGSTSLPTIPLTPGVFYDTAVTQRTVSGGFLARTNFGFRASPLACVTDSPTMIPLGPVAPGQLITLYGNSIGPSQPLVGLTGGASVPKSLGGVTVTFNGQSAPILYASSTQINVQAPFEIDQNPYTTDESTVMQLIYNGSVLATRSFAVTPQNPSLFLAAPVSNLVCGNTISSGVTQVALAFNQDGSLNSCANPAPSGSTFTLFVNGLGTASLSDHTGILTVNPQYVDASAVLLNGGYSLEVDAFTDQPGAISGVGQLTARVPYTLLAPGPMNVSLTMNSLPAGPLTTPVVIFVKP